MKSEVPPVTYTHQVIPVGVAIIAPTANIWSRSSVTISATLQKIISFKQWTGTESEPQNPITTV